VAINVRIRLIAGVLPGAEGSLDPFLASRSPMISGIPLIVVVIAPPAPPIIPPGGKVFFVFSLIIVLEGSV
jgi:hypothetical protein